MNVFRMLVPALLLVACAPGPQIAPIPGSARSEDLVVHVEIAAAVAASGRAPPGAPLHHPPTAAPIETRRLDVTLVDAADGRRIERAEVVVPPLAPQHSPVRRVLIAKGKGDLAGFSGDFEINDGPLHLFEIEARRPGQAAERFSFRYESPQ